MPAPYARRDWQTKIDRAVGRTSRGAQQGRFPGARPVLGAATFVPTSGPDLSISGELHYIEGWDVNDDTVDEFRTRYVPLDGSWNLELNGVRVHRDEFTVVDKTVTILNPTDLFLGADTQGTPWDLEIQYDRLITGPEPVLIIDDYDRANATLATGDLTSSGSPYIIGSTGGGSASIVSNQLVLATHYAYVDPASVDVTVDVDLTAVGFLPYWRVLARADGTGHAYGVDNTSLFKITGGGFSYAALATHSTPLTAGNHIQLVVLGSSLSCYRNGVLVSSATDTDLTSGTLAGLYHSTNYTVTFDNLQVAPL